MTVKTRIKKLGQSRYVAGRSIFYALKQTWLFAKFFFDSSYRSLVLGKMRFGKHYHQRPTFTTMNRYPLLFKECANYLSEVPNPEILSFGCSTGEEVFSIGQLIPQAHILGVDINPWCIRQAKKKTSNPNYSFMHRLAKEFVSSDGFDAIFCLAVFQRTENRTNENNAVADGFLFNQFESEIKILDEKLKPGGLMIIDNADFRFTDTTVSGKYTPLKSFEQNQIIRNRPVFDRNNQKISEKNNAYRIFVKG
ncbi:MAG: methyltransferase domain-containing protein [Bacteroidales bacterium]|nr:methyltransferase domain-containing protein [Bacteroidales bacterium]